MSRPELVCRLTDPEERARQRELQAQLSHGVQQRIALEDGYAVRFPGEPGWLRELAELVAIERRCCPFLRLELVAEAEDGPIWLRIRGPKGTKEFLERSFALCGDDVLA